jgi:acetyltransferase-like isoleucine patch superfamily enzyme
VWPHITVGQNTWIGDRAIIMADVGKHCVIGAGSLVSKPIPDYAVAVGVPAKVIRFRRNTEDSGSAEEPVLAPGDVG